MTPERSGACSVFTSADVTADQRTASRKAARRSGGSKPVGVTSGSDPAGSIRRPGSTSQMTWKALAVMAVFHALQGQQRAAVAARRLSLTTQRWPRTSTRLPSRGIDSSATCAVVVTRAPLP